MASATQVHQDRLGQLRVLGTKRDVHGPGDHGGVDGFRQITGDRRAVAMAGGGRRAAAGNES